MCLQLTVTPICSSPLSPRKNAMNEKGQRALPPTADTCDRIPGSPAPCSCSLRPGPLPVASSGRALPPLPLPMPLSTAAGPQRCFQSAAQSSCSMATCAEPLRRCRGAGTGARKWTLCAPLGLSPLCKGQREAQRGYTLQQGTERELKPGWAGSRPCSQTPKSCLCPALPASPQALFHLATGCFQAWGRGGAVFPYLILLSVYLILTAAQDTACHPEDREAQMDSQLAPNHTAPQGRAKLPPRPLGLQTQ